MNHIRTIRQLYWARPLEGRPQCIPTGRPRGAKAAGLRYEKKFAKALKEGLHGPWFEFTDDSGHGYCQPDIILSFLPSFVVVLEVKYTFTPEAAFKLERLYIPVVAKALQCPTFGIVVAKNLLPGMKGVHGRLVAAIYEATSQQHVSVLHWTGQALMQYKEAA